MVGSFEMRSRVAELATDAYERRFGRFGDVELRGGVAGVSELPLDSVEWRASGKAGDNRFAVKGHASVFDRPSLDLGGFIERIAPAAFNDVLDRNPDAMLLWDHESRWILGHTKANDPESLELRTDPIGLRFFSRVVDTSYARDLRVLMQAGIVRQASFAFTVADDVWEQDKNGLITRTVLKVADLYDVTITAMGAYPQADSSVVAERALAHARQFGRLTEGPEPTIEPVSAGGESPSRDDAGGVPDDPDFAAFQRAKKLADMRKATGLRRDVAHRLAER